MYCGGHLGGFEGTTFCARNCLEDKTSCSCMVWQAFHFHACFRQSLWKVLDVQKPSICTTLAVPLKICTDQHGCTYHDATCYTYYSGAIIYSQVFHQIKEIGIPRLGETNYSHAECIHATRNVSIKREATENGVCVCVTSIPVGHYCVYNWPLGDQS